MVGRILDFNERQRDAWVSAQASAIPPGSKVLDVGAGSCPYRSLFAHCNYVTQDLARLPAEQLRGEEGYGRIDVVSDILAIPLAGDSCDVVMATEVLEHVPDPLGAITELTRLLRPGGTLLLTAPLGSGIHQAPLHFYGGFTRFWYKTNLERLGFKDIKIEANGGFLLHYAQETARFAVLTKPWRLGAPWPIRIAWAPFWILLLPWLLFLAPIIAATLDRYDRAQDFTVGYFVSAEKQ